MTTITGEIAIREAGVVTIVLPVGLVTGPGSKAPNGPFKLLTQSRGRRAFRALAAGLVFYVIASFILARLIDGPLACVRDPEYAVRRDRLLAMQAKHPGKPIVLAIGSSRMVEGFRPSVLHDSETQHDVVYLNGGLVGSGSMLELLSYRRLKRDGLKPSQVLIEYWPPLLRGDNHAEYGRIDLPRLSPADWPMVRDYFPDPTSVARYMAEGQVLPLWRYRRGFQILIDRHSVVDARTHNRYATGMDEFGWWPGVRDLDADIERSKHPNIEHSAFHPYLDGYSIGDPADRALRDLIAECQADNVGVTLVYLPENQAFRTLYSSESESIWKNHVKKLIADTGVSLIMARAWDFEHELPDGVHLTQGGASRFTRRLADEWLASGPKLFRQPE
jgi:hypothetical protein